MTREFNLDDISFNIQNMLSRARSAAEFAGRNPDSVKVVAATKTVPAEIINYAGKCGIKIIGENRVQELLEKYDALDRDNLDIHFIGTLQTNKVKYIIDKVSMIHSVDSEKLAKEISRQALKHLKVMDVLVEVNIGKEASKSGVFPEEAEDFLKNISSLKGIRVCGLMAIPPACINTENGKNVNNSNECKNIYKTNEYFQKIQQLIIDISAKKIDNIYMEHLSLGMSEDFEEAIVCGSTMIRPGRCLFGERAKPV